MFEKLGEFQVKHPVAVGVALAALTGYSAWCVYSIGQRIGIIRTLHGLDAKAVSEALGG